MDTTEDLSARILLRHILSTEPPRTPVTRSASNDQQGSPRRSSRLAGNDAGAQTPQSILRRSMKNKMRESITRKSLPSTRRTASIRPRKSTPAPVSMMLDDGDTPRHILRNILKTEPARSPVLHKNAQAEEQQPPLADTSIASKRLSVDLSTFNLPDLTIGIAASTVKGLNRKRPHRTLDVTTFEKRFQDGDEASVEIDGSVQEHSTHSLLSSTSLSLKTPFVDAQTERRGLRRRVLNRRKLTEEEFGDTVQERQSERVERVAELSLNDPVSPENFTLGLSKFVEADVTTDVVNCNTALYAQHDALASSLSILPTQEKATVMFSQLQPQLMDSEHEGLMQVDQEKQFEDGQSHEIPTEAAKGIGCDFDSLKSVLNDEAKTTEVETPEGDEMEVAVLVSQTKEDESESLSKEEARATSWSEDESALHSQSKAAGCQKENDREFESEQESPERISPDSQAEDENNGTLGEEDENQTPECAKEYISRQARCSEVGVMPVVDAGNDSAGVSDIGWPDGKYNTFDAQSSRDSESGQPSSGPIDEDGSSDPQNPHLLPSEAHQLSEDVCLLSNDPAEEAAAQESFQEVEEDDDSEDDDEVPAFVRQKMFFSEPAPSVSRSVLQIVQPSASNESNPAPKPKQVRKRMSGRQREDGLPKGYLMNVFKHFAKTKVSADVYPVLKEIMDKYFQRLAEDLETYAAHAKRKTIEFEDAVLLLKRQGYVNDKVPVEVLIEKYLRMDQRRLLIPIATSGNVVIPKKR